MTIADGGLRADHAREIGSDLSRPAWLQAVAGLALARDVLAILDIGRGDHRLDIAAPACWLAGLSRLLLCGLGSTTSGGAYTTIATSVPKNKLVALRESCHRMRISMNNDRPNPIPLTVNFPRHCLSLFRYIHQ